MSVNQSLKLKQKFLLGTQQLALINLLQTPIYELENLIKDEIEQNPVLSHIDEQTEWKDQEGNNYENFSPSWNANTNDKKENLFEITAKQDTLFEQLSKQLGGLSLQKEALAIAEHIIGSIDPDGYLRNDIQELSDDLAIKKNIFVEKEDIDRVIKKIQTLEPAGIAARNVQECLILQVKRLDLAPPLKKLVLDVLENHFEHFTNKLYHHILKHISKNDFERVKTIIQSLSPKPGFVNDLPEDINQRIIPEAVLEISENKLHLHFPRSYAHKMDINPYYKSLVGEKEKKAQKDIQFIKEKIADAEKFITALKMRNNTLEEVFFSILNFQKEYFINQGDIALLKPMILSDIAKITGYDKSTISRIVNGKYIDTPLGIYPMKSFFSESYKNDKGESISKKSIKEMLRKIIEDEDKKNPLSDQQIQAMIKKKKYNLTRRTIAKYRNAMNIPVSRLRKD